MHPDGAWSMPASANYDIYVDGVTVWDKNQDDILGNGIFSYDIATKTLTVTKNYTLSDQIVKSSVNGLTIKMDNPVMLGKSTASQAMTLNGNTTFTGAGNFRIVGHILLGGDADGITMTVSDCALLRVSGSISGSGNKKDNLVISNSNVTVSSSSKAIYGLQDIKLSNATIVSPAAGRVKDGAIVDETGNAAKAVTIETRNIPADVNRDGAVDPADIVAVIKAMK